MSEPHSAEPVEREVRFSGEDMEQFAAASGDHSPLHTDPEFGRRTAFGECIVYGGLETIALLGLLPAEAQGRLVSVRSLFPGAVLVDKPYAARLVSRPGQWEVQLSGRGKLLARVSASEQPPPRGLDRTALLEASSGGPERLGGLEAGASGSSDFRPDMSRLAALAGRFGAGHVPPAILHGIAWASHAVGMSIPGFDGLCAGVTVVAESGGAGVPERQWLRVREVDERSDRVMIEGVVRDEAGRPGLLGLIECFPFAPSPLPEAPAPDPRVAPGSAGTAVVVGASRGAGAALALALLGRGYRVHGLYMGSERAVVSLRTEGLEFHRVDASDPAQIAAVAREIGEPVTGIVLCAAPPALAMAPTASELAGYVADALALATSPMQAFTPRLTRERPWIVLVSAAPGVAGRDLPQVAAAKGALEALAESLAASLPAASVRVARAPRMRTDQVNTPSARQRAVAPEGVAAEIVARLDSREPGLDVWEVGR